MVHLRKFLLLTVAVMAVLATSSPPLARARGWELITGQVNRIEYDENHVKLTLKPDAAAGKTELLQLDVPAHSCPADLKTGDRIRIWNKRTGAGRTLYRISPNRNCDPTGVRSRLRRCGHGRGGRHGGRGGHGGH